MSADHPSRAADFLDHILQAIERIERYVQGQDETGFLADEMMQDAVIRNIEIVGEAARNFERADPACAAAHPEIPWQLAYAMRNRVSHGYFDTNPNTVWATVQKDLPILRTQVQDLRATIPTVQSDAPLDVVGRSNDEHAGPS